MPLPRWPPLLPYLLRRAERRESDVSAAAELNWSRHGVDLPVGLSLQWLGTAGFRMAYQGVAIAIDPYLSRAPVGDVVRRRTLGSDAARVDLVDPVDAVLIGHTHFDHAVDAPRLAARDGATIYGSPSAAALMALHGLQDQAVVAEAHTIYEIGPFEVTFVPSVHSRLVLGLSVPYSGDICCDALEGLTAPAYKCGQVWGIHIAVAGVTFYHQGSCNLLDDQMKHRGVDYFLAGIAGRGFTERYWERILGALEPRVIVPHHHDDFFRPVDAPMEFSFNVNFARFVDEIRAVSKAFEICALEPLQAVAGPP